MKNKYLLLLPLLLFSFAFISAIDVSTCQELQDMNLSSNDDYVLVNDIYCSDTINWNEGLGFNPIGNEEEGFEGTLDGQGYSITDLYINRGATGNIGLFGIVIFNAVISNVNLVDVNITGASNTGGLAGYVTQTTEIHNSSVSGTVIGGDVSGGLVGYFDAVSITNSYSDATVFGGTNLGGLVGQVNGGEVKSCYATGDVNGNSKGGGFVGAYTGGLINNSYATGDVVANGGSAGGGGGFAGFVQYPAQIWNSYSTGQATYGFVANYNAGNSINCFWDVNTSGTTTETWVGSNNQGYPAYPKTTAEMKTLSTFTDAGWDIALLGDYVDETWFMLGENYPRLDGYNIELLTDCKTSDWVEGKIYVLQNDVSATGTCFDIDENDITLYLNGKTITGDTTGTGVGSATSGLSVFNGSLVSFDNGVYDAGSGYSTFEDLIIRDFVTWGFTSWNSGYLTINNLTIIGTGTGGTGFSFYGGGGHSVYNLLSSDTNFGIWLADGTNHNYFENITVKDNLDITGGYGIYASGTDNYWKNVNSTNNYYSDIILDIFSGGINNTFENYYFEDYYFSSFWGSVYDNYFKNSEGTIHLIDTFNGTGTNLMEDLIIENNYAYINSANILTGISNVTFNNMPMDFVSPQIKRDGSPCLDCVAYTDLNDATVIFGVSGFSEYEIGENLVCGIIPESNYTIVGGLIVADAGSLYFDSDINASYGYSYKQNSQAGEVIADTTDALSGTVDWFPIIIVIVAMVVLIFLVVLIIRAIKNTELTA